MRTAIVLGGGHSLFDDVAKIPIKYQGAIACNDAGVWWPRRLDAWVTLHPEHFERWVARRSMLGNPKADCLVAHSRGSRHVQLDLETDFRLPGMKTSGSSGLFAAKVALIDLGFDRVLFCGVPLSKTPHFFDKTLWDCSEQYQQEWSLIPAEWKERMRSMSGWTRDFLGGPETWKETECL